MAWSVRPGHRLSAGIRPWARIERGLTLLTVGDQQLAVVTDGVGEAACDGRSVHGTVTLEAGSTALLALIAADAEPLHVPQPDEIVRRVDRTINAWQQWADTVLNDGRLRDVVLRSVLTLKALTSRAGVIAGAATTSLPQKIGADRNYDYRFAWIRDDSYALDAMSRLARRRTTRGGLLAP
jgi:GH15 family glucan-1,4-alpha-glucosidase